MLLDWASSRTYDTDAYPHALKKGVALPVLSDMHLHKTSMTTASPAVLESMKVNERRFECFPADEGVSMIYMTLQYLYPAEGQIHQAPADPDTAALLWRSMMATLEDDYFGGNVDHPIRAFIQKLHHERTSISPEELSIEVKNAIHVLFGGEYQQAAVPTR